jgi:hypothetical protein
MFVPSTSNNEDGDNPPLGFVESVALLIAETACAA